MVWQVAAAFQIAGGLGSARAKRKAAREARRQAAAEAAAGVCASGFCSAVARYDCDKSP